MYNGTVRYSILVYNRLQYNIQYNTIQHSSENNLYTEVMTLPNQECGQLQLVISNIMIRTLLMTFVEVVWCSSDNDFILRGYT